MTVALASASGRRLFRICVTAVAVLLSSGLAERSEGQCTLLSNPIAFEPNPPGNGRPVYLSGGFTSNLALFRPGGTGPRRILMQESFGYSILDLTNPLNPVAIYYHDVRNPVGGPNSIPQHGDGQNMVQTIAVSPDGQRVAFSTTGPAAPFNTVVGKPDGATGFTLWGDFYPDRANATVIQQAGSRYIAYDVHGSLVTASDITAMPSSLGILNMASETTAWPGGYLASIAGNNLLYLSGGAIQVVNLSNPGPAGRITTAFPRTTITSADFLGRSIAYYSAAVDPGDATKIWVLVELNAQAGEKSPSYGLLSLTSNFTKVSAGPIWRVPSQAGEVWWANPGPSSTLVASNGSLFVLMWAQRALPGLLIRLHSTTTSAWAGVNSSLPPGSFDIPPAFYSTFSPGQPMAGFSNGTSVYAYLPTATSAYVIPMTCVSVNAPAAAIVGSLLVNDVTPVQTCETGTPAECTVFLGDKVTGTLAVLPSPALQPVTGWNFDFDFHPGAASEDFGGSSFPRLKAPDNGVFGNPSAPPSSFTLVGPCDPNVGGTNPVSGAGCWSSVKNNGAFAGGSPDFSGSETPGTNHPSSFGFEVRNQFGSNGPTISSLRWQVPVIRLKSAQILTGNAVDATGSDGRPVASGYSWYFGSNPTAPAGEILTRDAGCGGPACTHSFPGNGTRNFNVWVKVPYANGYVSPDCPGLPAACAPTALQPALKIQVADVQPAFLVNGAFAGPIMVVTSNPTIAITNQTNPGSFSPQYFYGLCSDATGVAAACQPTTSLSFSAGAGTIPTPQTGGAWFLRLRVTYGSGLFVDWLSGAPAGPVFPIDVTAVSPLVVGVSAAPSSAFTNQVFVFSANISGGLPPYTYEWRSPLTFVVGTSPTFQTSSPVAGTVAAWCFVTDAAGTVSSNSATVHVTAAPPVTVTVTASANSVRAVATVNFTCSATGGTGAGFSYSWSGNAVSGTGPAMSQTFSAAGNYVATCTASDLGSGAVSLNSTTVSVSPPVVPQIHVFVNGVDHCAPGNTCGQVSASPGDTLNAWAYVAGVADATPPSIAWTLAGALPSSAAGQNAAFSYASFGTYAIQLAGYGPTYTFTVIVAPPIQATGGVSPSWVYPGNPASFSCAGAGGTPPYTYTWSFSDGASSSSQNPAHAFAAPTGPSGTCTARDTYGVMASVTLPVTVIPAAASGPTAFFALSPCRLIDTRVAGPRGGPSIGASGSPDRVFVLAGACSVPSDARSLVTNVTVANAGAGGDLGVFGANDNLAGTTSVSFRAGVARANAAVVRLATDGSGTVRVRNNSAAPVDLILDVSGYFR